MGYNEERRIAKGKTAKKCKKAFAIGTPILAVCIAFVIVLITVILPKSKYNKAMRLLDSGDYDSAYALLEELGNSEAIVSSKYDRAMKLMDSGDYAPAYKLLIDLSYKDSKDKAEECLFLEQKSTLTDIKKGDTVKFGFYEQDNNTANGKEEIEWIVLNVEDGKALVISKYALDCQKYKISHTLFSTWDECTLRDWLNDRFLNTAFGSKHQELIPSVSVSADINPQYSTNPGNDITGKVFLLSIAEAEEYFETDKSRACAPTAYAKEQGAWTSESYKTASGEAACWWWLRSPGGYQDNAVGVNLVGSVDFRGLPVDTHYVAVRPAMWIDLGS